MAVKVDARVALLKLQQELLRIWEADKKTVVFITHDVDEAIYLADKIFLMTNGPGAVLAEIVRMATAPATIGRRTRTPIAWKASDPV